MKKIFKSLLSLNPISITLYVILLVIALLYIGIPILDLIELKSYDLRFASRGRQKATPEVVIAAIDEKSLARVGKWPWPRAKFGKLIELLSEDGAKVIGFDVGFWEPDENNNLDLLGEFENEVEKLGVHDRRLMDFIEKSKSKADNDRIFAESIAKSKAKVVLGHFFYMSQEALDYELTQEEIDQRLDRISNSRYPLIRYEEGLTDVSRFLRRLTAYAPQSNLEILSEAATSSGFFNMEADIDGIIRKLWLIIKYGEELYAPLSVQVVRSYLDDPQVIVRAAIYGIEGIQIGKTFIPTDEEGKILINFRGPEKTFPHYSISDILEKRLPADTFKNKIVLVAGTAIGLGDIRFTPTSSSAEYPGVEVHANIIDNILNNDFLHKPKWATIYDFFIVIIMGVLVGIIVPRTSIIKGLLLTLALFIIHIVGGNWLFSRFGIWVNMVYPLLTLILVYIALTIYHYLVEEKNKRFLHSTFSSYLSPELIENMVNSETMPELGGEERVITAYFTDIQSFSVFSEKLTAQQLVELLNEYLSAMTDILISEHGTLDKYEGDAIVAFLGAPMHIPDHPLRACRAAIDMQGELLDLRERWKNEKLLPNEPTRNTKNLLPEEWAQRDKWPRVVHDMKMRIGINSGEIVIGNMGSTMRMNYTMMGDAVNLAARLEAGAKQYGIYTAVSENTLNLEYINSKGEKERAMDLVEARFIDNITVVGKSEPVKMYELCAMKGNLTPAEEELFDLFDRGMRYYQRMKWDAAIDFFGESEKLERIPDGNTTPSRVFINRCKQFKEAPPVKTGEKWDGVYRMTEK